MMLSIASITIIVLYGTLVFVLESPRFLLEIGNIDQAVEIINKILIINVYMIYIEQNLIGLIRNFKFKRK